jgi:hypothetical protein
VTANRWSTLARVERNIMSACATGLRLHDDDPRVRTLEDLDRRGFGKVLYHHGWYFEEAAHHQEWAVERDESGWPVRLRWMGVAP